MKTIEELTGYDKAAIIYAILGDSVAINMFKDIPEAELYELRKHASKIKREVSIRVKKDVLDDYYFKILSSEKNKQVSLNENMFDFLNDLNDEQLFALLSKEKPKVIALGLDQIDQSRRMPLLSKLNQEIQTETVLQTGNLTEISLETVIHIAKDLKKKVTFLPGPVKFSRGGGKAVSEMLSSMTENDADQYLNKMKLDTPDLYEDVKKYFLLFDDIVIMPEKTGFTFWGDQGIDLKTMARALNDSDSETIEKLTTYLPTKKQDRFKRAVKLLENESLSKNEIDDAKKEIKDLLQSKINANEIKIDDILGNTT
jgi:flagellar motor switch protein FliG